MSANSALQPALLVTPTRPDLAAARQRALMYAQQLQPEDDSGLASQAPQGDPDARMLAQALGGTAIDAGGAMAPLEPLAAAGPAGVTSALDPPAPPAGGNLMLASLDMSSPDGGTAAGQSHGGRPHPSRFLPPPHSPPDHPPPRWDAQTYMNHLVEMGYRPVEAAGIVGQLQAESGFDTENVNHRGRGHGAYGLAQWRAERQQGLFDFAKSRGANIWDPQIQLEWVDRELHSPEYRSVLRKLHNARNVYEATAAMNGYEKPGGYSRNGVPTAVELWGRRYGNAQGAFGGYRPPQPNTVGQPPRPVQPMPARPPAPAAPGWPPTQP
jgi:hypothetical protein